MIGRVWRAVDPLVANEGMEIVDIDYRREGRGNVLRFYLDRAEGGVSIDELSTMSRRLGDLIEVHDLVPGSYTLEVSSPGINRRLRQPDHFRRYLGKRVRVRTVEASDGRRAFLGVLKEVRPDGIVCAVGTNERFVAFDNIAQANYEHEFPEPHRRRASGR
ncbi:MAG TPA: ribosome maturation factor RimP [Candidatus Dormibacteraeota bacterium]|nr:ribosome maturation factor RimP [Candidatus Dormibacteraeota bacterium]